MTLRPIGPIVSCKPTSGLQPLRLISPGVDRTPTRLQTGGGRGRAAAVGAEPERRETGGDRGAGPGGGAARITVEVEGVLRQTRAGRVGEPGGGPVGKGRLADHDRTRLPQLGDDGGVLSALVGREDLRPVRGGHILRLEAVLHQDRDAVQGTEGSPAARAASCWSAWSRASEAIVTMALSAGPDWL